jgi:hypothetical protein
MQHLYPAVTLDNLANHGRGKRAFLAKCPLEYGRMSGIHGDEEASGRLRILPVPRCPAGNRLLLDERDHALESGEAVGKHPRTYTAAG